MGEGRRSEIEEDYGLAAGSTFEPAEDAEEAFDLSHPHVMTVLGPIEPGALGVTLHHEHLIRRPRGDAAHELVEALDDPHATLAEIEDFHAAGGGALVDVSTASEGRDIHALLWVAARAPAHVIAVTGFRVDSGGATSIDDTSAEELATVSIREIHDGIDGTRARAGLLATGTDGNRITPAGETALRAAARVHRTTGVPISVHSKQGSLALEQITALRDEAVDPGRVIVEHLGQTADPGHVRRVLDTGAFVSFDQIGKADADADGRLARRIQTSLEAGHGGQLLITPDFDRRSYLRAYGGQPGWVYVLERFTLMLMEAGIDARTIRQLLVDNPQRALTIQKETTA